MTKRQLWKSLMHGIPLNKLLTLKQGQECLMFKAETFERSADILYVPDLELNELVYDREASADEIGDILRCCYTGNDFVKLCSGNEAMAKELFFYVDWQHPSSALPEMEGYID